MSPGAPSDEMPSAHTSTQQWQSFEMRMRQRRIDRLLVRAEIALDADCPDDAAEALEEAERLNASTPGIAELRARLPVVPAPPKGRAVDTRLAASPAPLLVVASPPRDSLDSTPRSTNTAGTAASVHGPDSAGHWVRLEDSPRPRPPSAELVASRKTRNKGIWIPRVAAGLTVAAAFGWLAGPRPAAPPTAKGMHAGTTGTGVSTAAGADAGTPLPPIRMSVVEVPATDTVEESRRAATEQPSPLAKSDASARGSPLTPSTSQAFLASPTLAKVESLPPTAPPSLPPGIPVAAAPRLESAPVVPAPAEPAPMAPADAVAGRGTLPRGEETTSPSRSPADDDSGVRATLARYASAYSQLDVDAAGAVWPGVDRRALGRAFDGLASQRVNLGTCDVQVLGETAVADCTGSATWTPKVGGGTRNQPRRWQFRLRNASSGWQITGATVR